MQADLWVGEGCRGHSEVIKRVRSAAHVLNSTDALGRGSVRQHELAWRQQPAGSLEDVVGLIGTTSWQSGHQDEKHALIALKCFPGYGTS